MIPPKITNLPPAPVRSDAPVDFSSKADAMVGALQPFADEANILAEFVNTRADNASASASAVAGVQSAVSADRVLSQQAASNAAGSAAAAASSASTANTRATAAQSSANASEASAVRAEDAAQYVEGISGGAAPIKNPNFQGVVKVNDVPLGYAATAPTVGNGTEVMRAGAYGFGSVLGVPLPNDNANTLIQSGFYTSTAEWVGSPFSGKVGRNQGVLIHSPWRGEGSYAVQFFSQIQDHIFKIRFKDDGNWSGWVDVYHTDNLLNIGTTAATARTALGIAEVIANIPSVPKSAAYTVTAADKGKSIDTTTNVTIPASVFAVGDVIVVTNTSATNSTITPAAGVTFRLAGSASTGARTLAGYGVATLRMASNNVWFASGAGLT